MKAALKCGYVFQASVGLITKLINKKIKSRETCITHLKHKHHPQVVSLFPVCVGWSVLVTLVCIFCLNVCFCADHLVNRPSRTALLSTTTKQEPGETRSATWDGQWDSSLWLTWFFFSFEGLWVNQRSTVLFQCAFGVQIWTNINKHYNYSTKLSQAAGIHIILRAVGFKQPCWSN